MNCGRGKSQSLLLLYGALAAVVISGLAYWLLGSRRDSKPDAARVLSNSIMDVAMDRPVSTQDSPEEIVVSTKVYSDSAPLILTDAERKASDQILSQLQQDLNAIEIANAKVIHQTDNEFMQKTSIQIFPPEPEDLAAAWESFTQRLSAMNLRDPVAGAIFSKAQYMEKNYSGSREFPFRVMQSFRSKSEKDAEGRFGVWAYEKEPDIRFNEGGLPFLSTDSGEGAGMIQSADLRKEESWERYGHLLHLMPELSNLTDPRAEKPNN